MNDRNLRHENSLSRTLMVAAFVAAAMCNAHPVQAQGAEADPATAAASKAALKSASTISAAHAAAAAASALGAATVQPPAAARSAATAPSAVTAKSTATQVRPILTPRAFDSAQVSGLGTNFSSQQREEQTTHITVGRSIFIDTRHRLARVYITNPDILDSYTASPNQVVLTAKKAGSSTLILWDESGEAKSYLISADMNVEKLRDSMKQALPNETIKVTGDEGRVVLTGTVGTKDTAEAAVKIAAVYSPSVSNSLAINSAQVKQVRLEVKVVEVDRSKINTLGFNFFGSGGQNPSSTTTGQFPSSINTSAANGTKTVTVSNPLNFSIYLNRFNIGATLQDLETMQLAQILAEPNITTKSGEKAEFLAGGEFPFPIVQSSSTGTPVISLAFKQYGVKLVFTPIVNSDGTIDLTVAPEVSALDYSNAVNISGYTIPAISTRRAETQVVLKSGETFAIAGLLDRRTTDLYSRTPGVASVPVLGELFKSKSVTHSEDELMVIVTPVLVDPVNDTIPLPPVGLAPKVPMKEPIPYMDPSKFDKELPKGAMKQ